MKAAIYYGAGDIRVENIERPKSGKVGIVIKVRAVGVCGTDVHAYHTNRTGYAPGKAIGHEFSGDVVEVGPEVKDIKIGDRVWAIGTLPCFECEACKKGEYARCPSGKTGGVSGLHGAFAEFAWIPYTVLNRNVIKIPDSMSYQDTALIEPVGVGTGAAYYAQSEKTDTAVVLGAGVVGLGIIATFKDIGISRIIATDVAEKRLAIAKELGADVIINSTKEDAFKRVMDETAGKGADIVMETAGKPVTFLQSIDMVRRNGKVLIVATYEEPFMFDPSVTRPGMRMRSLVRNAIRMFGWYGGDSLRAFDLIKRGKLRAKQVVTHTYSLDEVTKAFEMQGNSSESIKVMVEP